VFFARYDWRSMTAVLRDSRLACNRAFLLLQRSLLFFTGKTRWLRAQCLGILMA
jgi:hypothetical protein